MRGGEVGTDAEEVEEELDVTGDGEGGDDAGDLVVEGYAEVEGEEGVDGQAGDRDFDGGAGILLGEEVAPKERDEVLGEEGDGEDSEEVCREGDVLSGEIAGTEEGGDDFGAEGDEAEGGGKGEEDDLFDFFGEGRAHAVVIPCCHLVGEYSEGDDGYGDTDESEGDALHVEGEVEGGDGAGDEGGGDEGVNDEVELVDAGGEDSGNGEADEVFDVG